MKGNPVMKAKRVTGPTPHSVLHTLIGVRQINDSYPVLNDQYGKPVPLNAGETSTSILNRVKAQIAGRTFNQPREY